MAASQEIAAGRDDLIFSRPQDLPDDWYQTWDKLVSDMRKEAKALPMNTMMLLLVERIATNYIMVRMQEARGAANIDWEELRSMQKLWLNFMTEFATQLHRNSQTPEQRFMAEFRTAVTAAMRKVGPDATVRDLMPVLAEEMAAFGL